MDQVAAQRMPGPSHTDISNENNRSGKPVSRISGRVRKWTAVISDMYIPRKGPTYENIQDDDFVRYHTWRKKKGLYRKCAVGPYCVEWRVNQVNYVIRRSPTASLIIVHTDRLSKFHLSKEVDGITDQIPTIWKRRITSSPPKMGTK